MIKPQKKISFNFQNDIYKNQIDLNLARVKDEEKIHTAINKILNFVVFMTKVDRRIGQKRTEISYQSIDTFHIIALQNLDEYDRPNQINIRIYFNQIINSLTKYKKYKQNFLIEDLLFVLSVMNETNVISVNNA